jgi:hypothetical protein
MTRVSSRAQLCPLFCIMSLTYETKALREEGVSRSKGAPRSEGLILVVRVSEDPTPTHSSCLSGEQQVQERMGVRAKMEERGRRMMLDHLKPTHSQVLSVATDDTS